MASPPPTALGAGMAGDAASHCSRPFEGLGGGRASGPGRTRWASSRLPASAASPSLPAVQRGGRGCGAAPSPPGPGPPPLLGALSGGERRGMRVLALGLPPRSRGCVSAPWGWGGALCANSPLPPGCWSRGSPVEAVLGVGVPCGRGCRDPFGLKHSWSAARLLGGICCCFLKPRGCPEGSWGEGGLGLFLLEASRFECCPLRRDLWYPRCRRGALVLVVRIVSLPPK